MPSSNPQPVEAFGDLRVKLTWVTIFRTVATTLLLAVLAARLLSAPPPGGRLATADFASFAIVVGVYALTLVTAMLLRRGKVNVGAAWAQVGADIALASALVFLTGGSDSPFTFVYLVSIIEAAVLLLRRGAVVATVVSSLAFGVVTWLVQRGVLETTTGYGPRPTSRLVLETVTHLLAQVLVAVLATYVSEQLSRAGGRLFARERDLRQLVDLQDRIVTAMPSGLVTCDAEGVVTFVNPAGAAILGLSEDTGGLALATLLPGLADLPAPQKRLELQVETPRGVRVLGLGVTPLGTEEGARLVVFQDLTDLRRLQTELKHIDSLASLGRVSAELAHEVRNPLASMRGAAQLLLGDTPEGSQQNKLARLIVREADRLAALVESHLRTARPAEPVLRQGSVSQVAAETVEMLMNDPDVAGRQIEQHLEDVTARFDVGQFRQVLINLLRNALAVTREGGRIRVSTRREGVDAVLEVWDSAGSVAPGSTERIFEPFFTTQSGGTGLGLSMVKAILEAHGGSVAVSSSPQDGTAFCVRLPTTEA